MTANNIETAGELSPSLAVQVLSGLLDADQTEFVHRLAGLIPPSWFGTGATEVDEVMAQPGAPLLNIPLSGTGYNLSWIYVLYKYALTQSRIASATGVWLDRISYDFLGNDLPRLVNEQDDAYRARIMDAILAPKQTRAAIIQAVEALTGAAPKLIELWNPGDTGAYGTSGQQGYGVAGMYGSLKFNNQIFVTAYRPPGGGIPNAPGYGNPQSGYGSGGYGQYGDMNEVDAAVPDATIYATIAKTVAAGITAWTCIQSQPDTVDIPTASFGNVENTQILAVLPFFF